MDEKKKKFKDVFCMMISKLMSTFLLLNLISLITPMEMLSDNVQSLIEFFEKIVSDILLISFFVLWGREIENENVAERIWAILTLLMISMILFVLTQ